jgi:heptosyltransferase-3
MAFIRRAARLPVKDLLSRIRQLLFSLPRNIAKTRNLLRKLNNESKKPVFVILTGRMGDLIAAEPVIRHIKQPHDYIIWPCRLRYTDILRFNPFVDEIISVSSDFEVVLLQKLFSKQRWVNMLWDGMLCNIFGIKLHNPNPAKINADNRYAFGTNTDIFALLGAHRQLNDRPRLYPDPAFDADAFLTQIFPNQAPFLVLHPCSDEFARSWSVDKARALASWLLEHTPLNLIEVGMTPFLTPGLRVFTMVDRLTISQQMSVITRAAAFVGVDSGFSHIANSAGVPSVLLLGEHLGFNTHLPLPVHDYDIVVRGPGKTYEISVQEICAAVSRILKNMGIKS